MFEKNDKFLLVAKTIVNVYTIIMVGLFCALGIALAAMVHWTYLFVIIFGWLFCFLFWVFAMLILSHIFDVKLIRNKLYGIDNSGLEDFLDADETSEEKSVENNKQNDAIELELVRLQMLVDDGEISEEEYKERIKDLTNKN